MATLLRRQSYVDHLNSRHNNAKRTRSYSTFPDDATNDLNAYGKPDPPRAPRPVLIPIHPPTAQRPIRRLPSIRMLRHSSQSTNRSSSYADLPDNGSRKRKRPTNGTNENLYASGGVFRAATRLLRGNSTNSLKRSKSAHVSLGRTNSAMDLDETDADELGRRVTNRQRMKSPEPELIEEEEEEPPVDSCRCERTGLRNSS